VKQHATSTENSNACTHEGHTTTEKTGHKPKLRVFLEIHDPGVSMVQDEMFFIVQGHNDRPFAASRMIKCTFIYYIYILASLNCFTNENYNN
jgi:hypothetical protein